MNNAQNVPRVHPTQTGRQQEPGRRTRVLLIGVATAAALAAVVVVTGNRSDEPADPVADPHDGMVTGTVWVADEDGGSLSLIDAATNEVVTTVAGIEGPHNVQVTADGAAVWAVSGHDSLAVMLDAASLEPHGTVATGQSPAHVVVTPDGATAYTTDFADGTVTAIDTATMTRLATIPAGEGPHGARPSPDGRWLFVANAASNTLSVIDTAKNTLVDRIVVGDAPVQVAFSPDGQFVYASLNGENAVAKVDVASRQLVGKIKVGSGPIQTYVTPDDQYVIVANQGDEQEPGTTVSVIDTASFTVRKEVTTGRGSHGLVVEPSGKHAYVTNLYDNNVAVVDLDTLEVVATIPVGAKPNGISFSPITVDAQPSSTLRLSEGSSGEPAGHDDEGEDDGTSGMSH